MHAIHPFIISTGWCDGHDIGGGWEGVNNSPYRAWDGVHLITGIKLAVFAHLARGVNVGVQGARGE